LTAIFAVGFGLLGLAPLMQAFARSRASRDCGSDFLPSLAEPLRQVERAIGEASSRAATAACRGAGHHRFSDRSFKEDTMLTQPPKPSDPPLDTFRFIPEFADKIAHAVNNWAYLEYYVSASIWALAEVRPIIGACMTAQMFSLHSKLDGLLAIMKLRQVPQGLLDRVNKFHSAVRDAQEARNRLAHDLWFVDNFDPSKMGKLRITAQRILNFQITSYTETELDEDLKRLIARREEMRQIYFDINAAMPTLPQIPAELLNPLADIR
jgi:hypothetical protein